MEADKPIIVDDKTGEVVPHVGVDRQTFYEGTIFEKALGGLPPNRLLMEALAYEFSGSVSECGVKQPDFDKLALEHMFERLKSLEDAVQSLQKQLNELCDPATMVFKHH